LLKPRFPPAIATLLLLIACSPPLPQHEESQSQQLPISAQVELGGETILLEVARTPSEQQIGLMHRESLARDRGMFFPVETPRPVQLWMKDVSFPLDMVFPRDGEIVHIAAEVPPCDRDPSPTIAGRALGKRRQEAESDRLFRCGAEVAV